MKAFKSAHADMKEKVQNAAAKADEMSALKKASAVAKAERMEADTKAAKHQAKGNYHNKQAEILREYEQRKANNAAEKEQTKTALQQKKADKHTNKADKHAKATGDIVGDGETDDNVEQASTPATPSEATPAAVPEPASEAREQDTNSTDSTDAAGLDPVRTNQVPMHGSGVPTHSDLHSESNPGTDKHDARTTQTMGGSPNTGSYM